MENEIVKIEELNIHDKIFTIRGVQVLLDSDLAGLYGVELKRLNEQVKRNLLRFPDSFAFQLHIEEWLNLKSHFATSSLKSQNTSSSWGGKRKLPYVFTEQGVAMLSAVLKSSSAIQTSVQIMQAFVAMRRFIAGNAQIFQRLDKIEVKQIESDKKLDYVFNALESKELKPKQGIFFDGQIFDAYKFVSDIIRSAKSSILLIDNFIDDTVLSLLSKREASVKAIIFTKEISKRLALDLEKHNSQYAPIEIIEFKKSHDRFLIIDDKDVYHFGASLKDLGKKWFAFSKFDKDTFGLSEHLSAYNSQ